MTDTAYIFIVMMIALDIVFSFVALLLIHTTQGMIYDFKKEFRRFRDGEQYQCHIETNHVIGVKLNPDGSWSEIRANDKHIENGR